jgi:mono/diheme cytochrome c family protein
MLVGKGITMSTRTIPLLVAVALSAAAALCGQARATPSSLLADYGAIAGRAPDVARGASLFTSRHGRDWSCSSCHGALPVGTGRHTVTGKPISPMAPAANRERFSSAAKTEKWFRRNCNDVLGRECTAAEKADVLAWLMTLKP